MPADRPLYSDMAPFSRTFFEANLKKFMGTNPGCIDACIPMIWVGIEVK
jgi:hypothetical protein